MLEIKEIQKLYPDYNVIHGPYNRVGDNRKHVVLYNNNTFKRKTVSYSKLLLELKLGRLLIGDETCDHIDEDASNDSIDNLQVKSRQANALKSKKLNEAICKCGQSFQKKRKTTKYCSNPCRSRYTEVKNQYS